MTTVREDAQKGAMQVSEMMKAWWLERNKGRSIIDIDFAGLIEKVKALSDSTDNRKGANEAIELLKEAATEIEDVANGFQPDAMAHSDAASESYTGKTQRLFILATNIKLFLESKSPEGEDTAKADEEMQRNRRDLGERANPQRATILEASPDAAKDSIAPIDDLKVGVQELKQGISELHTFNVGKGYFAHVRVGEVLALIDSFIAKKEQAAGREETAK